VNQPLVCIVVLNWNALKETIECIDSLREIKYPQYKLIIVDNASSNNDAHVLCEMYSQIADIILAKENYGYTGGNNIGIEYAIEKYSPDYILILNNDIIVDAEATLVTNLAKEFFKDLLVGYDLKKGDELVEIIRKRYWAPSNEAFIACLKVAIRRYFDTKTNLANDAS